MKLHLAIAMGLVAGIGLGLIASTTESPQLMTAANGVRPLGTAFVNLLKMAVVPLVGTTVFVGVAGMGNLRQLGRIGLVTLTFFVASTLVSVPIGMGTMKLLTPLAGAVPSLGPQSEVVEAANLPGPMDFLVNLIPTSPFKAAADGALLPLMVFTVIFAAAVSTLADEQRARLMGLATATTDALIKLVHWILWTAPVGVFALSAPVAASSGLGIFRSLGVFVVAVIAGLIIFLTGFYLPVVLILGRVGPIRFLKACAGGQMIAFTTTSSAATIPVLLEDATENLDISQSVASLVIPLGAAMGRAGSALFQGAGLIFLAWLYGIELTPAAVALAILATTLVSFTVAAVPSASIITLAPALSAVGVPTAGLAILLGIDRIPDMFRTAVNVTGHMAAATVVQRGSRGHTT
ncbi:MAG: dicarboxylate/amino acid:cation symporter [Gemmatimonadales bacterium]